MPIIGGPALGNIINVGSGGLNFSALTALPAGRQSAVTTAANAAATVLSVTAQSIIDALAVGNGFSSFLPNDGCLLASSGGAITVQGDPVGAIRTWTGIELAVQATSLRQATSAATGLYADGTREMATANLSTWTEGEGFVAFNSDDTDARRINRGIWRVGTSGGSVISPFANLQAWYDDFLSSTLSTSASSLGLSVFDPVIYNARITSAGAFTLLVNNISRISVTGRTVAGRNPGQFLAGGTNRFEGTVFCLTLNSTLYSAAQRSAVYEFAKAYYGI